MCVCERERGGGREGGRERERERERGGREGGKKWVNEGPRERLIEFLHVSGLLSVLRMVAVIAGLLL